MTPEKKQHFYNRTLFLITAVLLSGGILVAFIFFLLDRFTPSSQLPVQIHFADNISPAHEELIRRFNRAYQGKIEVVPINLPFSKFSTNERKELLARSLRSKSDLIDVFAVDVIWVPRFARWAHPLNLYFSRQEMAQLLAEPLKSCYYNRQLLAIPLYTDIGMMYYRRDIIRQLPDGEEIERKLKSSLTWEEFLRLKNRLRLRNQPFYLFPADSYEGLICSFYELVKSQNGSLFVGDTVQLVQPPIRRALQFLVDLVNRYHATPPVVVNYDEFKCYLDALQRDAVFLRGWPGFPRHYRHVISDTGKFKLLGIAALPHFREGRPVSVFGGWNLMVSRFSAHKREAVEFIKFCLRPEIQKILYREGGYIPVNLDVYRDEKFMRANPDLNYYRRLLAHGVHRPFLENYTKISDIISYYVHLAIKGEISVDEALQKATHLINSNKFVIK